MKAESQRALGLVGLGLRGRLAIVGVQQVRDAVKKGKVKLALVAGDASRNSLDKIVPLLEARRVRTIEGFSADELGKACGRESVAVVGIVDAGLARGILDRAGAASRGQA